MVHVAGVAAHDALIHGEQCCRGHRNIWTSKGPHGDEEQQPEQRHPESQEASFFQHVRPHTVRHDVQEARRTEQVVRQHTQMLDRIEEQLHEPDPENPDAQQGERAAVGMFVNHRGD